MKAFKVWDRQSLWRAEVHETRMNFASPINNVATLTDFGRQRLSDHFFMRDMLYSEVGNVHGIPNIPDNPELALQVGREIAARLLEPLKRAFGHVTIRSAYRSPRLNAFCNDWFNAGDTACWCAGNDINAARHIWDLPDGDGRIGGTVTLVIPAYLTHYERTGDYRPLAWWMRDHIADYAEMLFFRNLCAFNIRWYQGPSDKAIWFLDPPVRDLLVKEEPAGIYINYSAFYSEAIDPIWVGKPNAPASTIRANSNTSSIGRD